MIPVCSNELLQVERGRVLGDGGRIRWGGETMGRRDDGEEACPRCGEEGETPYCIVFQCKNIRRVKDERGSGLKRKE